MSAFTGSILRADGILFNQIAHAFVQVFAFQTQAVHDVAVGVLEVGLFGKVFDDAPFVVPASTGFRNYLSLLNALLSINLSISVRYIKKISSKSVPKSSFCPPYTIEEGNNETTIVELN